MAEGHATEPHASIRMVRAAMGHAEPIFFLGATDTKNRLDAGKHCRTWIEVDVPPGEVLKYQGRVDIALIRSASTDETMAVIPEELIDRVSLHPNTLPTEAEARDGAQIVSENSMCRFWAVPKDRTRQQWLPTICLSMQRAVGFGTRNAQRKTGQRRSTGRAAVMYTPSYRLSITIFDKSDRPVPVRLITYISRDDMGCRCSDSGHGPMFAMASRPPPKPQTSDSTSRLDLGWSLATGAPRLADSFDSGHARPLGWNSDIPSGTTVPVADARVRRGPSQSSQLQDAAGSGLLPQPTSADVHDENNFESRPRLGEAALSPAMDSTAAIETRRRATPGAVDASDRAPGIDKSGGAGSNVPERPEDCGTSAVDHANEGANRSNTSNSLRTDKRLRTGTMAAGAAERAASDYVHLRLDINAADFVSVLTRPRPGPSPLDVLRALPAPPAAADTSMVHGNDNMMSTAGGGTTSAALVGAMMAGTSSGWGSMAGTRAREDASKVWQGPLSGSSATSLDVNGVCDAT